MLPLRDDVPSRTVPFVTFGLIALNVLVFLYQVSLGLGPDPRSAHAAQAFVAEFGVIPCRLTGRCVLGEELPPAALTILTSMFVHGGLFHVGGNMLYLWIFGNNVEDTLGHLRFAVFYGVSGVAAALTQTAVTPQSQIPMIGASGAVSGVLGAYVVLYPRANVLVAAPFMLLRVPAFIVLGLWFVGQLVSSLTTAPGSGGVAFLAHVGGFVGGAILIRWFLRERRRERA